MKILKHNLGLFKGLVFSLLGLCLFLSFQSNFFETCNKKRFEGFSRAMQVWVVHRIVASEKFGNQSLGGFIGIVPRMSKNPDLNVNHIKGRSKLDLCYQTGKKYLELQDFKPYRSNVSIQGQFFAWLKINSILSPGKNFRHFLGLNSIFGTVTFLLFLYWVAIEFKWIIAFITGVFIMQLDWIVASVSNLYFMTWSFFPPFIFNLFFLRQTTLSSKDLIILFLGNVVLCFLNA